MEAQTRSNLRIGIGEGLLATPWVILSLPAGFIISAMLNVYYGIRPGMFGLIASLPAWANASQILLLPLLAKFFNAREMTLCTGWLNLGLWVMLSAILTFLPEGDALQAGRIFLIFFILSSLSASFVSLGWTAWIRQWVPGNTRGEYFGKRNRYCAIVTLVFLLFSMGLLELYPNNILAYEVILITAAVMRFGSLLWQHRIVDEFHKDEPLMTANWWQELCEVPRNRTFVAFLLFNAFVNFWINATGPFGAVFIYDQLGMSPAEFAAMNIMATISGAISWPIWGRIGDRYGFLPTIVLGLLLWQGQNYLWCFLAPENSWLLYPMWFWGGFTATGFMLGSFNLILKILPTGAKTTAISLNLAATSVAAGVAPIISGQLLDIAQDSGWDVDLVYRIGFGLAPTAVLLALPFLKRIEEPEADPRYSSVLGSMRMARQTLQVFGINALANATLISQKIRKPKAGINPNDPLDGKDQ